MCAHRHSILIEYTIFQYIKTFSFIKINDKRYPNYKMKIKFYGQSWHLNVKNLSISWKIKQKNLKFNFLHLITEPMMEYISNIQKLKIVCLQFTGGTKVVEPKRLGSHKKKTLQERGFKQSWCLNLVGVMVCTLVLKVICSEFNS